MILRRPLLGFVLLIAGFAVGCNHAQQGQVLLETKWNKPIKVHRATDSDTFVTAFSPGNSYDEIDVRQFTIQSTSRVFTKNNAALNVNVAVTAHINDNDDDIVNYVANYGKDEAERHKRREQIIDGWVLTAAKEAFAKFDAYDVFGKQAEIQADLVGVLTPQLEKQMKIAVDSIQLGDIKFEDGRIEQQAAAEIAATKQKQIADAYYNAQLVDNKTKELQSQVFKDPNMLKIRELELQLQIEQARADGIKGHNGPLTIINGSSPALQFQVK